MNKFLKLFFSIVLVLAIVGALIYWDSYINSPNNFKVTYLQETDEALPENFKGINILYFSDLSFGSHFDENFLKELQNTISTLDYDVVIFGGDMFDLEFSPVSNDVTLLTNFFSSLDAPLGKFFVLGDFDTVTETRSVLVKKILSDANFESIHGKMSLYNGLSGKINLITDDQTNELEEGSYSLAVIHNGDNYNLLPKETNLVLTGHSHQLQTNPFAESKFKLGRTGNVYHVRSVGLTSANYRLFNAPEILLIKY